MFSTTVTRSVLGAVVAAAVLSVASACGSDTPEPPPVAAPSESIDPAAPPTRVTWQEYQSITLPVSAESGPSSTSPAARGYAHSPQGAALAAIVTSVRISTAPDSQWADQVRASVAPGAGRDSFMISRAQLSIPVGATQGEARPTLRGYIMTEYSVERARVDIITSYPDGSILSTVTEVLWRDGDWKLVIPDPASQTATQKSLTELPTPMTSLEAA